MKRMFPRSKMFYKVYFLNISLMICFIVMLSIICISYSKKFILNNITEFNQKIIDEKGGVLSDEIRHLDETIDMVTAGDQVFDLIMSDYNQYYSPVKILDIIYFLKNICSNYSMVDEISLIDYERGIVITSTTKMSLSEINYQEILSNEHLTFSEEAGRTVIRYTKNLNPVQSTKTVSIVLTLNRKVFEENLLMKNNGEFQVLLMKEDGNGLSEDGPVWVERGDWEQEKRTAHNLIVYESCLKEKISVFGIQNYSEISSEASRISIVVIGICLLVILCASFILYLFSLYFYKPLGKISDHISEMNIINQSGENNEYHMIEKAVNVLQSEKQQILEKYEKTLPAMIQKVTCELITERYDEEAFQYLLSILKRTMDYPQYGLLLMECENRELVCLLKERVFCLFQAEKIEAVYAELNFYQVVFLINTGLTYRTLLEHVREWKGKTNDIKSTWCLSNYFVNRINVNLVYFETQKKMKKKFFKEENTIIYDLTRNENGQKNIPSLKMGQKLYDLIRNGKEKEAILLLHDFTIDLSHSQMDIQSTIFLYFQLCSKLVNDLKESNTMISKEYNEKALFLELFRSENIHDLEEVAGRIVYTCMENLARKEKVYSANVKKVMEFIQKNYNRDLSLEEISGEVFLSVGYLSNLFKEETGCTVMEYVTSFRMRKAKELLLKTPAIKIKEISERIGYHNVQSFIRYFKMYYGVTPIEFRRKSGGKIYESPQ